MIGLRIGGAVAVAIVALSGLFMAGKLERDSRDRIEILAESRVSVDDVEAADRARLLDKQFDQDAFADGAQKDAIRLGIEGFNFLTFAGPYVHAHPVSDSISIAPGKSWSSDHIRARVLLDKVQYKQHGATVSARHSIIQFENISSGPIAYFARVRSDDRGRCEIRGARQHNAMALMPGEVAEVVVCAGGGSVRIETLEVLEVSELGYHYLSTVPPRAVGHDGVTASAHRPPRRRPMCTTVDVGGIAGKLSQGLVRWRDVVDYYARHDCERFRFHAGYRHAEAGPTRLPALPPA